MSHKSIRNIGRSVHNLNNFIRPVDQCLFAPLPYSENDPIFIIGAPRSGSTLTFQVLNQALNCSYLPRTLDYLHGIPHLIFRSLKRKLAHPKPVFDSSYGEIPGLLSPSEAFGYWTKWFARPQHADHYFPSPLPDAASKELRDHVYSLQGHLNAPLLVKCFYLSLAVPALSSAFPNSRFIYLQREPFSNISSIIRAKKKHLAYDWWSIKPPGYSQLQKKELVDQAIWQLAETTNIIKRTLGKLDESRWRLISFEEICQSPRETINNLLNWLNLYGYTARADGHIPEHFANPKNPDTSTINYYKKSAYYNNLLNSYL